MRPLGAGLAALALVVALEAQSAAPTTAPWQPRPVIIIDPRPYVSSPAPQPAASRRAKPRPRATPVRRRPSAEPTPETFERLDTSPSPRP